MSARRRTSCRRARLDLDHAIGRKLLDVGAKHRQLRAIRNPVMLMNVTVC
jgi:hypothetical protein